MADTYKVIEQRPVQDVSPGGSFEPAYEITFETAGHGVTGKVRIPVSRYTPAHVDEVIRDQVEILESVATL